MMSVIIPDPIHPKPLMVCVFAFESVSLYRCHNELQCPVMTSLESLGTFLDFCTNMTLKVLKY